MKFVIITKRRRRLVVATADAPAFLAAGYIIESELEAPGALKTPYGWEVPTDHGAMGIMSAYRAGLLPAITKEDLLKETELPNESELFEAYGHEDPNASRNRDAAYGHGEELPGDKREAESSEGPPTNPTDD